MKAAGLKQMVHTAVSFVTFSDFGTRLSISPNAYKHTAMLHVYKAYTDRVSGGIKWYVIP